MGDVGNTIGGVSLESYISPQEKYKFISIGSFGENNKYFDQGLRIKLNEKTRKYLLNKDDLVMILNDKTQSCNILGSVLKIERNDLYIHNQRTQRITPNNELFSSNYLYFYINSDKFRKKIKQISQGNTQVYINWNVVEKCNVWYPKLLNEQTKISSLFNIVDSLLTLHQRKCEKLKKNKQELLNKMFV